jgi:glucose/mannose transport system permease protein
VPGANALVGGTTAVNHDVASAAVNDRRLVIPLVLVVVLVILGHVSLKSFDLVYAMVGQGPGFATDVPGIFVFDQTFRALRYNTGAAASVVMLVLGSVIIVPYLYRSVIREKR